MPSKYLMPVIALVLAVCVSTSAFALDKTHTLVQAPNSVDRDIAPWGATDYCTLNYYNFCSGWIYVWSGWSPSDVVGLDFDAADCPPASDECTVVEVVWMYLLDTYPSYGFTAGPAFFRDGDQLGHLGAPVWIGPQQEWVDGWNLVVPDMPYHGVGIVGLHLENPGTIAVTTESHPKNFVAGCDPCPTAPGLSYWYGSLATGNFSGSAFAVPYPGCGADNDLLFDVIIACVGPTAVESSTWGGVKSMYR